MRAMRGPARSAPRRSRLPWAPSSRPTSWPGISFGSRRRWASRGVTTAAARSAIARRSTRASGTRFSHNCARMKKKSRFLQTPIEPFAVEAGLTADQILARMERISFQGRNLATAHRIWQRMLQDDVTIFLGMAGALSAGGLRLIVAHLISNRWVDCLVSTGANLYHDLHETRGQRHYLGSPHADDAALADERIDRVYDTFASEEEFIGNDNWIADFAATLESRPHTTREFLHLLGGHLWNTTGRDGILTAAYRANVPIFCPAIADSSIGMGISQARQKRAGTGAIDIIGDIVESANLIIRRPRTASIVLGGGTPKNFINQASVQAEFYSDQVSGHRYE